MLASYPSPVQAGHGVVDRPHAALVLDTSPLLEKQTLAMDTDQPFGFAAIAD